MDIISQVFSRPTLEFHGLLGLENLNILKFHDFATDFVILLQN